MISFGSSNILRSIEMNSLYSTNLRSSAKAQFAYTSVIDLKESIIDLQESIIVKVVALKLSDG